MIRFIKYLLLTIIIVLVACNHQDSELEKEKRINLNVIVPDDIWDREFWPNALQEFEQLFDCDITLNYSKLNEKFYKDLKADSLIFDVVVGVAEPFSTILDSSRFAFFSPLNTSLAQSIQGVGKSNFIPVYFSYLGLLYKPAQIEKVPLTFGSLQDGIWIKSLIIPDAENSQLGRSNLYWSVAAFGKNGYGHFWRSIKHNIFSIQPDSDSAFRMFLAGEAPMMLGYSSYVAYQRAKGKDPIDVVFPVEGSYCSVFQAGISRKTTKREKAEKFIEYLLSNEFQTKIPEGLYMYPINKNITLPSFLDDVPKPKKLLNKYLDSKEIKINSKYWILKWQKRVK